MRRSAATCAVTVALLAAGCSNPNLTKRELVVVFAPTAPPSTHAAALAACAHATPKASPEPMPTPTSTTSASTRLGDVRYRIDAASDRDLNVLLQCLRRQPGVIGFQQPEADG